MQTTGMDPLTIGFENALHDANATPEAPDTIARLVEALRAVIEASPHRARASVTQTPDGRVELRKDGEAYVLERDGGRWHLRGNRGPGFSGPVAAALTEWLTS